MIAWLRSLFGKKEVPAPFDLYKPNERTIYSYWNGKEVVQADPMVLYKRMSDVGPDLEIDLKVASAPMKDASAAQDKAIAKVQKIFEVVPLADGGLTQEEMLKLLFSFCDYIAEVKKKPNYLTAWPNSAAAYAASWAGSPTTPNSLDSGCSENGTSTDVPMPSPLESASPSE